MWKFSSVSAGNGDNVGPGKLYSLAQMRLFGPPLGVTGIVTKQPFKNPREEVGIFTSSRTRAAAPSEPGPFPRACRYTCWNFCRNAYWAIPLPWRGMHPDLSVVQCIKKLPWCRRAHAQARERIYFWQHQVKMTRHVHETRAEMCLEVLSANPTQPPAHNPYQLPPSQQRTSQYKTALSRKRGMQQDFQINLKHISKTCFYKGRKLATRLKTKLKTVRTASANKIFAQSETLVA